MGTCTEHSAHHIARKYFRQFSNVLGPREMHFMRDYGDRLLKRWATAAIQSTCRSTHQDIKFKRNYSDIRPHGEWAGRCQKVNVRIAHDWWLVIVVVAVAVVVAGHKANNQMLFIDNPRNKAKKNAYKICRGAEPAAVTMWRWHWYDDSHYCIGMRCVLLFGRIIDVCVSMRAGERTRSSGTSESIHSKTVEFALVTANKKKRSRRATKNKKKYAFCVFLYLFFRSIRDSRILDYYYCCYCISFRFIIEINLRRCNSPYIDGIAWNALDVRRVTIHRFWKIYRAHSSSSWTHFCIRQRRCAVPSYTRARSRWWFPSNDSSILFSS